MKGRIAWENDERTLLKLTIDEAFTLHELSELRDGMTALVQQVTHNVDVMILFNAAEMPPGFLAMMQRFDTDMPANINRTFVVGGNQMFFRMTREFMLRFRPTDRLKNRLFLCETEADAGAIINGSKPAQSL
ncbi:MAG: hypothetical protein AAF787_02930 [Chloroflexota bacterium]